MTRYQQLYNYTDALVYLKRSSTAPYLRNRLICTSRSSIFKWVAHIGQKIHSCLRQRLCILSAAPHHKYYSGGDGFVLPVIVSVLFESTLCSRRLVDVYSWKCKTAVKRMVLRKNKQTVFFFWFAYRCRSCLDPSGLSQRAEARRCSSGPLKTLFCKAVWMASLFPSHR